MYIIIFREQKDYYSLTESVTLPSKVKLEEQEYPDKSETLKDAAAHYLKHIKRYYYESYSKPQEAVVLTVQEGKLIINKAFIEDSLVEKIYDDCKFAMVGNMNNILDYALDGIATISLNPKKKKKKKSAEKNKRIRESGRG